MLLCPHCILLPVLLDVYFFYGARFLFFINEVHNGIAIWKSGGGRLYHWRH
jgi:hypothetical protein